MRNLQILLALTLVLGGAVASYSARAGGAGCQLASLSAPDVAPDVGLVSVTETRPDGPRGKIKFSVNVDGQDVVIQNGADITYIGGSSRKLLGGGGSSTSITPAVAVTGETAVYRATPLRDGKVLVKIRYETVKLERIDTTKVGDDAIQAPVTDRRRYENVIILTLGQTVSFEAPVAGGEPATFVVSRPA
ncbi:hypothetical protein [Gluconacetobacter sp.]|uniref:hypothetical protein n=1 Tax=Gluconacetobacter sp. TaxID=1935994 RepID=UPI0039E7F4F9